MGWLARKLLGQEAWMLRSRQQMTGDRGQKTEDTGQMTEDGLQKSEWQEQVSYGRGKENLRFIFNLPTRSSHQSNAPGHPASGVQAWAFVLLSLGHACTARGIVSWIDPAQSRRN